MKSIVRKTSEKIATHPSGAAQGAVSHAASPGLWIDAFLIGAILGVVAQFLRQAPGMLMDLGASTAPWVMAGFLLAFLAARGDHSPRKAILAAAGTMAAYLFAWLVSYHLLFVLLEEVPMAAGWREAMPWLILTVPASLALGTVAALSHKSGLLGDACLTTPIAWSLPEVVLGIKEDSGVSAVVIPVVALLAVLIGMTKRERPVRVVTLLSAAATFAALGSALYPLARILIPTW